jgi:hypothetical protein
MTLKPAEGVARYTAKMKDGISCKKVLPIIATFALRLSYHEGDTICRQNSSRSPFFLICAVMRPPDILIVQRARAFSQGAILK